MRWRLSFAWNGAFACFVSELYESSIACVRRGQASRGVRRGSRIRARPSSSSDEIPNRWTGTTFDPEIRELQQPTNVPKDCEGWQNVKYLEQYIDDQILDVIVLSTNRTAVGLTGKSLCLTRKELKVYLGIVMIMSVLQYLKIDMYWMQKWRVPVVANAMNRSRFML